MVNVVEVLSTQPDGTAQGFWPPTNCVLQNMSLFRRRTSAMAKDSSVPTPARVLSSTLTAASDAIGCVSEGVAAVGAEDREAIRMEKDEHWGRVEEGDTLWGLSSKYLGDSRKWRHLQAGCRKELGADPLMLRPGSHVTESCVARAQKLSQDNGVSTKKKWLFGK